jgi:hypothetical protein
MPIPNSQSPTLTESGFEFRLDQPNLSAPSRYASGQSFVKGEWVLFATKPATNERADNAYVNLINAKNRRHISRLSGHKLRCVIGG